MQKDKGTRLDTLHYTDTYFRNHRDHGDNFDGNQDLPRHMTNSNLPISGRKWSSMPPAFLAYQKSWKNFRKIKYTFQKNSIMKLIKNWKWEQKNQYGRRASSQKNKKLFSNFSNTIYQDVSNYSERKLANFQKSFKKKSAKIICPSNNCLPKKVF